MKQTCEIMIGEYGNYFPCGKPAKYTSPTNRLNKKKMVVCGIHKNSIDNMHKNIDSAQRCIKLEF